MGFVSIVGKFTRNLDDFFTAYACDSLLPCRRACYCCIVIVVGNMLTAKTTTMKRQNRGMYVLDKQDGDTVKQWLPYGLDR